MKVQEEIEVYFNMSPVPIYVPGIDIFVDRNKEIVYTATKENKLLEFVVRDDKIYLIGFDTWKKKS